MVSGWEGIYAYIWLIHVAVQQKLTQHCKAMILQLKVNFFKLKKKTVDSACISHSSLKKYFVFLTLF